MERQDLEQLINRYISGECSEDEKKILDSYLDSFQQSALKDELSDKLILSQTEENLRRKIFGLLEEEEIRETGPKIIYRQTRLLKYAAGIALFLSLWGAWQFYLRSGISQRLPTELSQVSETDLYLVLSNGSKLLLQAEDEVNDPSLGFVARFSEDGILTYIPDGISDNQLVHTIHVPPGKKMQVRLSDGSQIKLNSGSDLTYPVRFENEKPREVQLNGEGFFEIEKSEKQQFIARADGFSTSVYGTKFNISAYKDDLVKKVYLVEGSIGIKSGNEKEVILKPKMLATLHSGKQQIETVSISQNDEHIGWRSGKLVFNNERMQDIIKKLERQYDYKITNVNNRYLDEQFTGRFDTETIEEVLFVLKHYMNIDYTIDAETRTIEIK